MIPGLKLMKIVHRLGGVDTPTSWPSTDLQSDQSMSPTSCATVSDADSETNYTIGVTENTPYACRFCDKAFPRQYNLKNHEQHSHAEQQPYICEYCNKCFKHKRSRDRHIKLHTNEKRYQCEKCDTAFHRSDHLKIHQKTHDTAKPYQCALCNRGYSTPAALTSHLQNHKKNNNKSPDSPGALRCLQCPASFATGQELQQHVHVHDEDFPKKVKLLPCNFCPEHFPNADTLKQHVENTHPSETQGKCPECSESFATLEALLQHKKTHEVNKDSASPRFSCGICSKNEFATKESLQKHMQDAHLQILLSADSASASVAASCSSPVSNSAATPEPSSGRKSNSPGNVYWCEYCTMQFNNVPALQKHTLFMHSSRDVPADAPQNVRCQHCGKTFQSDVLLSDHVKAVHERRVFKKSAEKRQMYRNSIYPSSPLSLMSYFPQYNHGSKYPYDSEFESLICSLCQAGPFSFPEFIDHYKVHLPEASMKMGPFNCTECDGKFSSEDHLDLHMSQHYLGIVQQFECQICTKVFTNPDHLQKHHMDSHAQQLFQCSICKEMFERKVDIQLHFSRKHCITCDTYKCKLCNATCKNHDEFVLHTKLVHSRNGPKFTCTFCNEGFSNALLLNSHYETHKRIRCPLCHEEFAVEYLLDRHIQEKHPFNSVMLSLPQNEEEVQNLSMKSRENGGNTVGFSSKASFRCDMCDSSFSGETSLNVHRRQVHNIRNSGSQKPGQTTLSKVCAYCNESYKSRTELENHMKSHGSLCPSKHKCNICDEICPSAATLADHKLSHCKVVTDNTCVTCHTPLKLAEHFYAHLKQHNAQGLPASCVVCRQVLMSEIEVEKHADHHLKNTESSRFCCVCGETSTPEQLIVTGTQNSHSYMCRKCFRMNGEDLRCFECKVKFETLADLEKHKLNHVHTYNCIKCQMNFSTNEEAQAHIKTHVSQEGPDHRCHICPKVFDTPFKLTCHLIEHNFEPSSVYACYMCEASFTSPHLIRDHMVEHGMHVRRFDCLFCYQRFFFKAELDNHLIFSHPIPTNGTDLFQCKVCGQFFASPEHLEEHSKYHGEQSPTTKRLKCSLCPESFDSVADLKQHHFGDHNGGEMRDFKNKFPCTQCDQVFPCLSNLQGHLRVHTLGAAYVCKECNKEFPLARNLSIHMRQHTGQKPYKCNTCNMSFSRKENLKTHIKTHNGVKPYMCPHCGKSFTRKSHSREHMRTHATSTTHPCEMCSETFPSVSELDSHLKDVHMKTFQDRSGGFAAASRHILKLLNIQTNQDNSGEESSLGPTSVSGNSKDSNSSDCSSNVEEIESDTRDSSLSIVEEPIESLVPTPQAVA